MFRGRPRAIDSPTTALEVANWSTPDRRVTVRPDPAGAAVLSVVATPALMTPVEPTMIALLTLSAAMALVVAAGTAFTSTYRMGRRRLAASAEAEAADALFGLAMITASK